MDVGRLGRGNRKWKRRVSEKTLPLNPFRGRSGVYERVLFRNPAEKRVPASLETLIATW